jgi:hypothetical protein
MPDVFFTGRSVLLESLTTGATIPASAIIVEEFVALRSVDFATTAVGVGVGVGVGTSTSSVADCSSIAG